MKSIAIIAITCSLGILGSCADQSGFSGGGDSKKPEPAKEPVAAIQPSVDQSQQQQPGTQPQPAPQTGNFGNPVGTQQTPNVPSRIVDGQEVFNTCGGCVNRAKEAAQSPQMRSRGQSFVADISRTINLGYYKINPSENLCDVHFMANMNIRIDDHDGGGSGVSATLGNGQIILYCPCDCPWAKSSSGGGFF